MNLLKNNQNNKPEKTESKILLQKVRQQWVNNRFVRTAFNVREHEKHLKSLTRSKFCKHSIELAKGRQTAKGTEIIDGTVLTNSCKNRRCPGCAKWMNAKKRAFYLPSIYAIQKAHESSFEAEKQGKSKRHLKSGMWFTTLTVPNCFFEDLPKTFEEMRSHWRLISMWVNKLKKRGQINDWSGMWSFEVTFKLVTKSYLLKRKEGYVKALAGNKAKNDDLVRKGLEKMIKKIEDKIEELFGKGGVLEQIIAIEKSKEANLFKKDRKRPECKDSKTKWSQLCNKMYEAHPHYHVMMHKKSNAQFLVKQWLKRFPNALRKAQDIQKVHDLKEGGMFEIVKYITKPVGDGLSNASSIAIDRHASIYNYFFLHVIHKKNMSGTFGEVKKVSEEKLAAFLNECKEQDINMDEIIDKAVKDEPHIVDDKTKHGEKFFFKNSVQNFVSENGVPFCEENIEKYLSPNENRIINMKGDKAYLKDAKDYVDEKTLQKRLEQDEYSKHELPNQNTSTASKNSG